MVTLGLLPALAYERSALGREVGMEASGVVRRAGMAVEGLEPGDEVVFVDGGCIANGEPVGASGLRQVYENVLQLRGAAGEHQVPGDPRVGYTHVYGAPGISGVTILAR